MPGGKGKSIGGKGGKGDAAGKAQKSHSAKAGLQVSGILTHLIAGLGIISSESGHAIRAMSYSMKTAPRRRVDSVSRCCSIRGIFFRYL